MKAKMKTLSFKYKLFLALTFIIFFYAICSVLFVNLYLKDVLRNRLINDGRVLASTISSHVTDEMLTGDYTTIDKFFKEVIKNNPEASYVFIEQEGRVLLRDSRGELPKEFVNIRHERGKVSYVVLKKGGQSYYDFSAPILGQSSSLRLGISGKAMEVTLRNTTRSLLFIAFVSFLAAISFSAFLSRKLIRPLSELTSSAVKIADGDYSEIIHAEGGDEVGKLSLAFGKMADAVRLREGNLREINEELEVVNVKLHEYIKELDRTRDELVKAKQDMAVVETKGAVLHHIRQPLTYLIMSIDLLTNEIRKGNEVDMDDLQKRLNVVREAGLKLSDLLKKFENLREYRVVEYPGNTRLIDIEE